MKYSDSVQSHNLEIAYKNLSKFEVVTSPTNISYSPNFLNYPGILKRLALGHGWKLTRFYLRRIGDVACWVYFPVNYLTSNTLYKISFHATFLAFTP